METIVRGIYVIHITLADLLEQAEAAQAASGDVQAFVEWYGSYAYHGGIPAELSSVIDVAWVQRANSIMHCLVLLMSIPGRFVLTDDVECQHRTSPQPNKTPSCASSSGIWATRLVVSSLGRRQVQGGGGRPTSKRVAGGERGHTGLTANRKGGSSGAYWMTLMPCAASFAARASGASTPRTASQTSQHSGDPVKRILRPRTAP